MDEGQLVQLFQELSISSCSISRHPQTGISLQEGFVEFQTHEDALKAVQILNGLVPAPNVRAICG